MKKRIIRTLLILSVLTASLTSWIWAALPEQLVPVGSTVGIQLHADGLVVVGFEQDGPSAAKEAGMKKGDIIKTVNGTAVTGCDNFRTLLSGANGGVLEVTVLRNGKAVPLTIQPEKNEGNYRLGILVRNSMAGIGTVTYYDPQSNSFGALGHGVSDTETMVLLPLGTGAIIPSDVVEIKRGAIGEPGALRGTFDPEVTLGTVECNTEHGIFGKGAAGLCIHDPVPVADRSEIRTGKATILANIDGKAVQEYQVEITRLFPMEEESGRNMLLTVTDPKLLENTGGIVQGMSGSPIIQNGRIVGAVTHVLVNDPTRGYGIFIENMLEAAE